MLAERLSCGKAVARDYVAKRRQSFERGDIAQPLASRSDSASAILSAAMRLVARALPVPAIVKRRPMIRRGADEGKAERDVDSVVESNAS